MGDRLKQGIARLKSLEMQGYKTFASKNVFGFSPTITAIVGPNGSGKSNIADAIRWVLGEQSFNLLRGKRTEDMIFSGSDNRARASMAAATITFDNEDGWLPIDFSEVTIGRRAFRDGQNEYILNGQKVRLRDLNELLSTTGLAERTYTIIGQGLVDTALSLRADQRRQLFEEAAGIGLYRSRREEALRRLETTRHNLERVQDILSELRPRVRSLRRQVDRSKDYDQVRDDLQELLRIWYGHHWYKLAETVANVTMGAEEQTQRRDGLRQEQNETEAQIRVVRAKVDQLRNQLRTWSQQASEIQHERERLGRAQAIAEERQRWVSEQETQYLAEIAELQAGLAGLEDELQAANEHIDRSRAELEKAEVAHAELVAAGEVGSRDRESLRLDADRSRGALEALAARTAVWESRRDQLSQNKSEQASKLEHAQGQQLDAEAEAKQLEAEVDAAQVKLGELEGRLAKVHQSQQQAENQIEKIRSELGNVEKERNRLTRLQGELSAQVEVFESTYSGSRRIMAAWELDPSRSAAGLVGRLRDSLNIDREVRRAILAALGEFRDGLTFESFEQVMQALEHPLLVSGETRTALLAAGTGKHQEPMPVPKDPGCLGLASDFVKTQGVANQVLHVILGRTLVVRDRKTAWKLLSALPGDARVVTLAGDVFLPSGQVLVGVGRQADLELEQIDQAVNELQQVSTMLTEHANRAEALQDALDKQKVILTELQTERLALQAQLEPTRQQANSVRLRFATLQSELQQKQSHAGNLAKDVGKTEADLNMLLEQGEDILEQRKRLESEYQRIVDALETTQLSERMLEAEATLDRLRSEVEGAVIVHEGLQARVDLLQRDVDLRRERLNSNKAETSNLKTQSEQATQQLSQVEGRLAALEAEMQPAEESLAAAERTRSELETGEVDLRMAIQASEREHSQAQISLARRQEELTSLQRRIVDDFGLVAFEESDDLTPQEPLPLEGIVERLTRVEDLPLDIEDQIQQLRLQLRRMGPVNPEARKEYVEVSTRVDFLTEQVDDLRKAEAQIHEVIAELDVLMEREFRVTYEAVASAFKETFTRLFGGGSARLELTQPDDLTLTGIDIEARLPGRRTQSLAMLSGGERSLTACALIFSLLKVSPTPFCVLDEVDAMLDESNVARFIGMLKELSQETQFILITHNRLTVQAAEVVYGISMGADTASKVISMNLEEAAREIAVD
ncbi:MAG: chromosome segregation protein SMC [Anaerolineales bacterium]|nr:MAG: chromosome segregation protein SMC [Anaerolineales bacterium]